MKKIGKDVKIMIYKSNIITIERIKNDTNGNPRYNINILFKYDVNSIFNSYFKKPIELGNPCYMECFKITSCNISQDIKDYIDKIEREK